MKNLHHQSKSSWRQVLGDPPKKESIKDWIDQQNKKFSQLLDWLDDLDDEGHGGGVVVRTGVNHVTGGITESQIKKLKEEVQNLKKDLEKSKNDLDEAKRLQIKAEEEKLE